MSTPRPTAIALLVTLALTSTAVVAFAAGAPVSASAYLLLFIGLFALRVAGQIGVVLFRPSWLPPMHEWNFVPYRLLLPAQLVILAAMIAIAVAAREPAGVLGRALVGAAFLYWAAMGVRYGVRMARLPAARWLGGTIPIVFHCVLPAFLFVLGASHA